jgi:uncharacterized LabA/DUF88 family protein
MRSPNFSGKSEYLFIDGGYMRKVFDASMHQVFGRSGALDVSILRRQCVANRNESSVSRAFFYDCIDDERRPGESDDSYEKRVGPQREWLRSVQLLDGFFVRLGTVTGRKPDRIRQKEVDVLVAVDMLEHSFRRNMDVAWLLAGDGDFVPIVESLVRLGTYVRVVFEPKSASAKLFEGADENYPLEFDDIWAWGSNGFRAACSLPTRRSQHGGNQIRLDPRTILREGVTAGGQLRIWSEHVGLFTAQYCKDATSHFYDLSNRDWLENYIAAKYGAIKWNN